MICKALIIFALIGCAAAAATPKFSDKETSVCYNAIISKLSSIRVPQQVEALMETIVSEHDNEPILHLPVTAIASYSRPKACTGFKVSSASADECKKLADNKIADAMMEVLKSDEFNHVISAARVCDFAGSQMA